MQFSRMTIPMPALDRLLALALAMQNTLGACAFVLGLGISSSAGILTVWDQITLINNPSTGDCAGTFSPMFMHRVTYRG